MKTHPLVLIIDDEKQILTSLQEILIDEGFDARTLDNPESAIDLIGELIPDLILLDIFMPNINGLDLLTQIKKEYPNQQIMMISGFGTIPTALEAIKKGALDFIEKPLNLDEILNKIAFLKKPVSIPPAAITEEKHLVGESYLFKELVRNVDRIAQLKIPILIYGCHGTGKTIFAKHIHQHSYEKKNLFTKIDCSESSEKISFDQNIPLIGTLYLSNINYLPLKQQSSLFTFLQNNNHDLRIIASASQPLFDLVKKDCFFAPLFHLLNIVPLEIPTLDKRKHDIPLLADHFLSQENIRLKKHLKLSTSSIRILRNSSWQGNVTQLKNFITLIAESIQESSYIIPPSYLLDYLQESDINEFEEQGFTHFTSLQQAQNVFEKKYLLYHLKKSNYDLSQVSDKLRLKVPQLRARMQELDINVV